MTSKSKNQLLIYYPAAPPRQKENATQLTRQSDDAASGELKENGFTRRFNYRTSLIPNKCKLKNNFESVLLDLRDQSTFTSNNYVAWGQHVLRASSQPFRFIVSFTPKPGYEYLASRASSLDRIGGDKILRDLNWNTWD